MRTLYIGDVGPDVEAAKRSVFKYLEAETAWRELVGKPLPVRRTFGPFFGIHVERAHEKAGQPKSKHLTQALWKVLDASGSIDAYSRYLIQKYEASRPDLVSPLPQGWGGYICQGLHPTAALLGNWAIDFCADPGTPILAVEAGVIRKLSGHDPNDDTWDSQGVYGWSVHFETKLGYRYYVTHLGRRANLAAGQRVGVGQVLGWVGDQDFRPDHEHYGVTSPLGEADARKRITAVSKAPRVPLL